MLESIAMPKTKKTILFIFLLSLFCVIAPLTVFYSLGWRFDWINKRVTQPGIFYFKIWPKSSQIYINGSQEKKTDFFFGSALIDNLTPKKYVIEIKKDGFFSWKKTLEITKGEATEAKNILLFPVENKFNIISNQTNNFFVSQDEKKAIIQEFVETSTNKSSWFLNNFDIARNLKVPVLSADDLAKINPQKTAAPLKLINVKFSFDSNKILLETSLAKNVSFYLLELDKTPIALNYINLPNPEIIQEVYFNPENNQQILFLQSNSIFKKDLTSKTIPALVKNNIVYFYATEKNIFYIDNAGFLTKTDFGFLQDQKLNTSPIKLADNADYKIYSLNSYVFLKENNTLYELNNKTSAFDDIISPFKNGDFSRDGKKFVYFTDNEIWILFLTDSYEQPEKKAGEKISLARFSSDLNNIFWLNDYYLIFSEGNKIKIAEIDNRDSVNIYDIGDYSNPKIFWSADNRELFTQSGNDFYYLLNLAP